MFHRLLFEGDLMPSSLHLPMGDITLHGSDARSSVEDSGVTYDTGCSRVIIPQSDDTVPHEWDTASLEPDNEAPLDEVLKF